MSGYNDCVSRTSAFFCIEHSIMACFICRNEKLAKFLDLGHQPPSDAFVRKENREKPEARYPLTLHFCPQCGLVQLGFVVDPEILFREYVYTTGANNQLRANFKELVAGLVARFKLTRSDFVVDIGSNDGTLLENYAQYGVKVLGIEPSSAAVIGEKQGIPTLREFFNEETAKAVVERNERSRVITATNVFAHVDDLASFMRGIKLLLSPGGVFVSESGYLLDMIETGGYDAIYHEHLRYYSLKPLMMLFEMFGMEIFDVERIPSHNGSIRVYAGLRGAHKKSASVRALAALEEKSGLYKRKTFTDFARRVAAHRNGLKETLREIKSSGKRVVGIGAPAKGNTLLNYCGFTSDALEYLAEKSALKIGLFSPGSHIPVVGEERLFQDQPEYALMLSWNLAGELILKLKGKGYRGRFIIPFPEIRLYKDKD